MSSRLRPWILTALAAAVLARSAFAGESVRIDGFRVVDYGVYAIGAARRIKTPWGERNLPAGRPRNVERTDIVCPRPGTQFGVGYVVEGAPDHGWARLSKRIYLVSAGPAKSPGNRTSFTEDRVLQLGEYEYDGWTVSAPPVIGVWRFEYWRDNTVVYRKDFTLDPRACLKA